MDDGKFVSPSACRVDAIDDTDQVPRRSQHHMRNRRNASPASRPHFMTQGMWFAWLLRGDIRQGSAPDDPEAQREFVAWWLFWGRAEYPEVWHWGSDQAVVAMQLVTTANGLTCPRLLRRLHASRPDLQHAFRLHDEESLAEFFAGIACTARWNWMLLQNFPRCVWQLQNLRVNDNPGQHAAFRFLASPLHSLIATRGHAIRRMRRQPWQKSAACCRLV
jgi:hypothetical protein